MFQGHKWDGKDQVPSTETACFPGDKLHCYLPQGQVYYVDATAFLEVVAFTTRPLTN